MKFRAETFGGELPAPPQTRQRRSWTWTQPGATPGWTPTSSRGGFKSSCEPPQLRTPPVAAPQASLALQLLSQLALQLASQLALQLVLPTQAVPLQFFGLRHRAYGSATAATRTRRSSAAATESITRLTAPLAARLTARLAAPPAPPGPPRAGSWELRPEVLVPAGPCQRQGPASSSFETRGRSEGGGGRKWGTRAGYKTMHVV